MSELNDRMAEIAKSQGGESIPRAMSSKIRREVRAFVIGPVVKQDLTTGETREIPPEGFTKEDMAKEAGLVDPPFDPLVLSMMPENNSHMGACIDAMVTNIDGFGHSFRSFIRADEEIPEDVIALVRAEKIKLANFFTHCCGEETFVSLRKKMRRDLETVGYAAWEVVYGPMNNELQAFNYVPAHHIRMTKQGSSMVEYEKSYIEITPEGGRAIVTKTVRKRFRRFVQKMPSGRMVYFKEFGDPRDLDYETGIFGTEEEPVPIEKKANAIKLWHIHSSRTPYGLPRYIGNLYTLFGDRAADEVNYVTLKNNNVPSMMVLVSNGQLTTASIERMKKYVETHIQGSANYSRFLVVEGEPLGEDGADAGTMKMDIKPLTSQQMKDEMFGKYAERNKKRIREAWRLPPIFVGASDEYTRATAEAARKLADEQVFAPERADFDAWINMAVLPMLGAMYHEFVSNGPNVTDDEDLIRVLMAAERTGSMTPKLGREIIGDIMGRNLPPVKGIDPEVPFSFQLAQAVKNNGEMQAESQVMPLAGPDAPMPDESDAMKVVKGLLDVRKAMEEEISRRLMGDVDEFDLPRRRE